MNHKAKDYTVAGQTQQRPAPRRQTYDVSVCLGLLFRKVQSGQISH